MLSEINLAYSIAGMFVGALVGLTGVGGGSLMAPILIIFFGFNPAVAVGTDLWFAALTKAVGGSIHHRIGSPDWQIVKRLALGSLPAALLTLLWLGFYHHGKLESDLLMVMLGVALLLTAVLMLLKSHLTARLKKYHRQVSQQTLTRLPFSRCTRAGLSAHASSCCAVLHCAYARTRGVTNADGG